ncbi:CBS domain-containing protein [Pseudomonas sp. gcc21]|uniref:CBS domain-containing protein n=1 Tax=Pseudomonas sp. gcc21 TaxID=2726989 RepID=UPI001452985B|nr:CBS domain-containing protein [Pseudomonas sp. gcc21]QJD58768.1 CBS domain-containing protein [Pseudomonas sp. gcc21]
MLKIVKVRDYMTTDLICVSPHTDLTRAVETLLLHKISGAPVVDGEGRLVGMLSEADCLKGIFTGSYFDEESGIVESVMTQAETINAEEDIVRAAEYFIRQGRRRLPVLDGGELVGQISRRDILRAVQHFNDNGARK